VTVNVKPSRPFGPFDRCPTPANFYGSQLIADLSYPIPSESAGVVKTMNGARVGDLFMSLIHTCETQ
jgi:hypothetical protein